MSAATFKALTEDSENHKAEGVRSAADSGLGAGYVLNNSASQAADRFDALGTMFDDGTISNLERLGVTNGWQCLEVGGGSGSIALWLSERVGPTGRVLVTDINTCFLAAIQRPNLEVRQHDIVTDSLPESAFDLVHARLVLMHLPQREAVLERLFKALKPGGWLVDEEFDTVSLRADPEVSPGEERLNSVNAFERVLSQRGVHLSFGRILFGRMRALGFKDVSAEGRLSMSAGRSAGAALLRANFEQLRGAMIQTGLITAQELARDIARLDDPEFVTPSHTLWAVQGRRPHSPHVTGRWPVGDRVVEKPEPCGWSVL
jgi:SAM-dependent methyltransferase